MRVSLRDQYSNFLYNTQNTQSRLMDLNMQGSSQKRINKPSDDPIGSGRVLNYRESISEITQYQDNINTAKGWLGLADESMLQVSTLLTQLRGLAEQGATGTMTASDREATGHAVRQLFNQLISLSNTEYQGNSIFAGHKVKEDAYREGLMSYDQNGNMLGEATGATDRSISVQFLGAAGSTAIVGTNQIDYRYSNDGGRTWKSGALAAGQSKLDLGGVNIQLPEAKVLNLSPATNTQRSQGSWLTVAPTAIYQGDHEFQAAVTYGQSDSGFSALPLGGFERNVQVQLNTGVTFGTVPPASFSATVTTMVNGAPQSTTWSVPNLAGVTTPVLHTPYGGIQLSGTAAAGNTFEVKAGMTAVQNVGANVNAMGKGAFGANVMVRIDNPAAPPLAVRDGTAIQYSYSMDGGVNWSTGHTAPNPTAGPTELPVPGGSLTLEARGGNASLPNGAQFIIHPQTAGHRVEISAGQYIQVNNMGAAVFGGHYEYGTEPIFADSDQGKNIFLTVGKLVAALENNDQSGCAQALENLKSSQEYFSTHMASVGARENRLDVAGAVLSGLKLNQKGRMSATEDVDLSTLMTELANQQLSYEAVLKSSAMIMQMNLLKYV